MSGEVDDQDKLRTWAFQCILEGNLLQILIKILTESKADIPTVSTKCCRYIIYNKMLEELHEQGESCLSFTSEHIMHCLISFYKLIFKLHLQF